MAAEQGFHRLCVAPRGVCGRLRSTLWGQDGGKNPLTTFPREGAPGGQLGLSGPHLWEVMPRV